jgi:hypothetical protein
MSELKVNKLTGITGTSAGAPITLSGDTATLGTGATIGSGVTFPAGHVLYTNQVKVISTGAYITPTTYTTTGLEITVPSASAALGTKIEITFTNNIWADYNNTAVSRSLIDVKLERTAPSAVDLFIGTAHGHYLLNFHMSMIYSGVVQDVSLGSGDHTYILKCRKNGGSATAAGNIFPLGTNSGDINVIIAKVIK